MFESFTNLIIQILISFLSLGWYLAVQKHDNYWKDSLILTACCLVIAFSGFFWGALGLIVGLVAFVFISATILAVEVELDDAAKFVAVLITLQIVLFFFIRALF